MTFLGNYCDLIRSRGNNALAESIEKASSEAEKNYLSSFNFTDHETGLLFGNVQSGKTGQLFGIMCKAADLGFPIFLLLTSDNVTLQKQTLERAQNDLKDFCVLGENDSTAFTVNNLEKPVVVVLKKNSRMLKLWSKVLATTGYLRGNPLIIVDDEADNASLNTLVNREKQSSINKYIAEIKDRAVSSIYLQVTGTPQAIFLQTLQSGFKPAFIQYFKPGKSYLGGNFFFPDLPNTQNIKILPSSKTINEAILEFVLTHMISSGISLLSGGSVSNSLAHPGIKKQDHAKTKKLVLESLEHLKFLSKSQLEELAADIYHDLVPSHGSKPPLNQVLKKVQDLLNTGAVKIIIMNGDHFTTGEDYETGCNIIIGGNNLGRGVTFPNLNTFYYTRTSKQPQADTMWQHNRMFGYDRDPGMVRVFMDQKLLKLFTDINHVNNSLIAQIEKGYDSIHLLFPTGLNPTRKNVIDNKHIDLIPGGTNFFPMDPDNLTIDRLDKLLSAFDEKVPFHQVSLRLIKALLEQIEPSPDFPMDGFLGAIDAILSQTPSAQAALIVRKDRHITQGTGALLSPNDVTEGKKHLNKTVLTMYEVTSNAGWKKPRLWVPNISLPADTVFYNLTENKPAGD